MHQLEDGYILAPEGQDFEMTFEFILDMDSAEWIKLNPEVVTRIEAVLSADLDDSDYYELVEDVFNTDWVFEAYGVKHKLIMFYGVWACPL